MAKDSPGVVERRGKGRPKGSVNKATIALRHALEGHGFDITEKLVELYKNAENDKIKLRIAQTMLEYTHPKLKDIDIIALEDGKDQPAEATQVNVSLTDLIRIASEDN